MSVIRRLNAETLALRQKERDVEPVYVVADAGGSAFHRIENAHGAVARRNSASSDIVGGNAVDSRGLSGDFDILIDKSLESIDRPAA